MRTFSRNPPNLDAALFRVASKRFEGTERMRRAAELVLVHGYAKAHVAREMNIRHRQQVWNACRRILDIAAGLKASTRRHGARSARQGDRRR